jgi:hypothetical protein
VTFPEQTSSEALPYTKISGRSLPCWVSTKDHKGPPISPEQTCSPSLPYIKKFYLFFCQVRDTVGQFFILMKNLSGTEKIKLGRFRLQT